MERQKLPLPVAGWDIVEGQSSVVTGILSGRIVYHHRDQCGRSVAAQRGNAAALILPGEPGRHTVPGTPSRDVAVDIEVAADFVKSLVLFHCVINLENYQIVVSRILHIHYRHAGSLVIPGKPIGHIDPGSPTTCDVPVCIELSSDSIFALVLRWRVIDHQDDEF